MSRHEQEQRLLKLRFVGKIEQFILTLTEAIDRKRKVILKGYSSSNSNQIKDRIVVPINLVYNNENLWAYDLEKKEAREFRLSRITDIETDIEDAGYSHAFKKGEADIFRWINPKVNYHIRLKMSIAALNCLLNGAYKVFFLNIAPAVSAERTAAHTYSGNAERRIFKVYIFHQITAFY